MSRIRNRLTYANVMSTIAVFFVLGGGAAFAANELAKNSVGAKQLKKEAVTAAKIKKEAVAAAKIKAAAVVTAKLANGAVSSEKIADAAVTAAKLAADSVATEKLAGVSVTADKIAPEAVATGKLGPLAVTGAKLADGSISSSKLGNISVREKAEDVAAGTQVLVGHSCPNGETLMNWGYFWDTTNDALTVQASFRFLTAAMVRAKNGTGADRKVTVQLLCLNK